MSLVNDFVRKAFSRRNFIVGFFASLFGVSDSKISAAATLSLVVRLQSQDNPGTAVFTAKANSALKVFIEYGYSETSLAAKSQVVALKANATSSIKLSALKTGAKVFYRVRYAALGKNTFLAKPISSFSTPASFTKSVFAVQADPHMDENSSADVYNGTLKQIVQASPAFLVDLGDIFMVDKLPDKSEANIRARYQLMSDYYKKLGTVPLKIVLGNHDGELGYSSFNTKKYRAEYFPEQTNELSYYAFEGPDQLHVCLDPFTFTTEAPKSDGWQWTLGATQYQWLKNTLSKSQARFKFVYIHHLLVGDAQSRGGVEIAKFNEWGGKNADGTAGFASKRPGWYKPVHDLLVENKVTVVFKGHDHLYVTQELDGIIYQTVPQPSHPGDKVDPTQYGYSAGKTVGGSGFLKVSTQGSTLNVDFVKFDGSLADSYKKVIA